MTARPAATTRTGTPGPCSASAACTIGSAPNGLEIGYWVRSDRTGRGLATSAASALTASALALDGVSRVEIHCDAANRRSAAIPEKLGYRLDRVETRPPTAPGETERHMIWVFGPAAGTDRR